MTCNWLTPDFASIMPELKKRPNWVLTRPVLRDGKLTKPPLQSSGRAASTTDPATWCDFETARDAYLRGGFGAVGFVLDRKPHWAGKYLLGFDWDHCIDNGVLDPAVRETLVKVGFTEVELSVSGTGVRAFMFVDQPVGNRRTQINGRSVELYDGERFLTTTGRKIKVLG